MLAGGAMLVRGAELGNRGSVEAVEGEMLAWMDWTVEFGYAGASCGYSERSFGLSSES